MKHLITPVALLALAACGQSEPEVVGGTPDPLAAELVNAAPVTLPPALKSSKSYRCKNNDLVFVDFMTDDVTARVRTDREGPSTTLKAPAAGEAFVAEGGYAVEGTGSTLSVTLPGKAKQECVA